MPMKYDKLIALLHDRGYSTYRIRMENLISQSAWQKIRTGTGDLDTRTLSRLCQELNVQPGDIMEYVPEARPPLDVLINCTKKGGRGEDDPVLEIGVPGGDKPSLRVGRHNGDR